MGAGPGAAWIVVSLFDLGGAPDVVAEDANCRGGGGGGLLLPCSGLADGFTALGGEVSGADGLVGDIATEYVPPLRWCSIGTCQQHILGHGDRYQFFANLSSWTRTREGTIVSK